MHKSLYALTAAALGLVAGPAHAYLDPGTGSAILQGIIGALAALLITLKLYWHRLLKWLGLRKDTARGDRDAGTVKRGEKSGDKAAAGGD